MAKELAFACIAMTEDHEMISQGLSWLRAEGIRDAGFAQRRQLFSIILSPPSEPRLLLSPHRYPWSALGGVCNVCEIKAEEAPS